MELNICNVYLEIYTLNSQHSVAVWSSTSDSHIHASVLELDPSDRYLHQLRALEAASIGYIVNLGHPHSALHTRLASDLATLQHQIDQMSDNIVLQVQHRKRQARKAHHKMLTQRLHEHLGQNHEADINFLCLEAVENINRERALRCQDKSTSSSLTSKKGIPTTKFNYGFTTINFCTDIFNIE